MANLTLPGEVRRAFVAAVGEATTFDYAHNREAVDPDHAYDAFMSNLEAEGYRVVRADGRAAP